MIRLFPLLAIVLPFTTAGAQTPEPLEAWEDWVLADEAFRACPVLTGTMPGDPASHICAWPGELRIQVGARDGRFDQRWRLYQESWLPLPGSPEQWPVDVRLNGEPAAVVNHNGRPGIQLAAGEYRVLGAWRWTTRPANLAVPPGTGLIRLSVDGDPISVPELADGRVWLGQRAETAAAEDRLTVAVYRLLSDGIPVTLTTRIELQVSGSAREITLAGAMLPGFGAQALSSALPVVLDDDNLRVQLRPGRFDIQLISRTETIPQTLPLPAATAPWPAFEIWSFAADTRLRVASLEGAPGVDAAQAGAPPGWRGLPTYRVSRDATLELVERSRGEADVGNRLQLVRDLWLDFDGSGLTARDQITGRQRAGRLDMAGPYLMTSARSGGERLLITDGAEPGIRGVELRAAELRLTTSARVAERGGALPITGYLDRFDSVRATLQLPPGFQLLAARGADQAPRAWINQWRLLDIFLVLIISVAALRLIGPTAGAVALSGLVLTFHEPNSLSWSWLWLLLALALMGMAPEGKLRSGAQRLVWATGAVVVVLLLPFAASQLKLVLFPQLEPGGISSMVRPTNLDMLEAPSQDLTSEEVAVMGARERAVASLSPSSGRAASEAYRFTRYLPDAQVQTGPGVPNWQWRRYQLSWDGPVEARETLALTIAGPWLVRVLRFAGVLLSAALLLMVGRAVFGWPQRWPRFSGAAALLPLMLLAGGWAPGIARAETPGFPSPDLLDELRARLTEPAPCRPDCADVMQAAVTVTRDRLAMRLDVAVAEPSAVPLPGQVGAWEPLTVRLAERAVSQMWRSSDGRLWVPLAAGVHQLELAGPLLPDAGLTVPFPLEPRYVQVEASGWEVVGLRNGRLPSSALELVPVAAEGEASQASAVTFEPFVRVNRELRLDLDWSVITRVSRITPAEGPFTLEIDLLPSESVVSEGVQVRDRKVLVAFGADQREFVWLSSLPNTDTLTLRAATDVAWSEVWGLRVSPLWHSEASGLPETAPRLLDPDFYMPEYYPRPGESLALAITRPAASEGDTLAFDQVQLDTRPGQRVMTHELNLKYRSSRGARHSMTLPKDAELIRVAIDGSPVPLALLDGRLDLPVTPGEHGIAVEYATPAPGGLAQSVGALDLGMAASNVRLSLGAPGDRWVLLTYGPGLGPAILYWSELVVFVLLAVALGRLRQSPFKVHEWLLLGLGLSTFAWPVLILFAAWAFVMVWRRNAQPSSDRLRFNVLQVALAIFSLLALGSLVGAIPTGLLGRPDMQVASPLGFGQFIWFADRSGPQLPAAGVISVSLWFYKAAMLAWALWLSFALVRWVPWAWQCFSAGGMWRGRVLPAE